MTAQENCEKWLKAFICVGAVSCAYSEFKACRWRFIGRGHTFLALSAFYPGVYLATNRLLSWGDTAIANWRQKHETKHLLPAKDRLPPQTLFGQEVTPEDSETIRYTIRLPTLHLAMTALSFRHFQLQRAFGIRHEPPLTAIDGMGRLRTALWHMQRDKLGVIAVLLAGCSVNCLLSVAKLLEGEPERIL